jgi:hypothetical protein
MVPKVSSKTNVNIRYPKAGKIKGSKSSPVISLGRFGAEK